MDDQRRLVASLNRPFVETHISYVLFDAGAAYKIKKAVRFPFLDFTTLAAREFFCREELRLNRRFAPSLYLGVVPITGTVGAPVIGGDGRPIEFAVKMRAFDQDGLLSRVIARDELTTERIDALGAVVADFHAGAARAPSDSSFGRLERILEDALENFVGLGRSREIDALREWTGREAARLQATFAARRRQGLVRECHGDLHLGNIALVDGAVTLFDCIEFNADMRWIDVMSDVAFLVMDLRDHHRPDLAARFLNGYLARTADYAGLDVLRFYVVYRAMVRAKIARLGTAGAEFQGYVDLAARETVPQAPALVITHGVSGSGKSTRAQALVERGAIAIRSDVERRRLFGPGEYRADATQQTYDRLAMLARTILSAGYTVVVDATFLRREQRDLMRGVAGDLHVPFTIADCSAPVAVLKDRVARRAARGDDVSEATLDVLAQQLATEEPLGADEIRAAV